MEGEEEEGGGEEEGGEGGEESEEEDEDEEWPGGGGGGDSTGEGMAAAVARMDMVACEPREVLRRRCSAQSPGASSGYTRLQCSTT